MINNIMRLFESLRNKKPQPIEKTHYVTINELLDMLRVSNSRIIGLKSTVKQFGAMMDSDIKEVRKRHYAKLKNAAIKKLDQEEIENATLHTATIRHLGF